jgi:hypothetical protein
MSISAIGSLVAINVNNVNIGLGGNEKRASSGGPRLFGQGSNQWAIRRDPASYKRAAYFDTINGKDGIVHFAHLYGPAENEGPRLMRGKPFLQIWQGIPQEVQAEINVIIEEVRAELAALKRPDEFQAIEAEFCDFAKPEIIIQYTSAQFSVLEALRRFRGRGGQKVFALPPILRPPRVLSANVLMVCSKRRELIVQLRGDVATYPHHLHVFGGAFRTSDPTAPDSVGYLASDINFFDAALRELKEETGHVPTQITAPMFIMSREIDTGYVQFSLLGLDISEKSASALRHSWEGRIATIPFDDLGIALGRDGYAVDGEDPHGFVPSGRALILAWLAEGAPSLSLSAAKRPYYSAIGSISKAHELYAKAISQME